MKFRRTEKDRQEFIFKEFGYPLDKDAKHTIERMPPEVDSAGARYNDDGPALLWASERLEKHKGKDNFLVVISDGQPVPSLYYEEKEISDLEYAVKEIMNKQDQFLIGLGIGDGVRSVKEYYPNHKIVPNTRELAKEIGGLLKDMIRNPEQYH